MKIEITCRFSGKVLFSHDAENNSMRLTVEAAVSAGANLAGANLDGANLAGSNLAGSNLAGANLAGSNLAGSNLAGANLAGSNLARANLAGSNLAGANLDGANLAGSNLDGEKLTKAPLSMLNLKWSVLITAQFMRIGCQRHSHEAWRNFSDEEIENMASDALEFWREWKGPLLAMCDTYHEEPAQDQEAA